VDAYGLDIDIGFGFANVMWSVAVANVTGVVGLANVTVLHWIRKSTHHDEVRLPRDLLKIVHRTRKSQIDLCHCSDQI
jgi:hypothetical protein